MAQALRRTIAPSCAESADRVVLHCYHLYPETTAMPDSVGGYQTHPDVDILRDRLVTLDKRCFECSGVGEADHGLGKYPLSRRPVPSCDRERMIT